MSAGYVGVELYSSLFNVLIYHKPWGTIPLTPPTPINNASNN